VVSSALVAVEAALEDLVKDQDLVDMVEEATADMGTEKTSLRLAEIAAAVPTT